MPAEMSLARLPAVLVNSAAPLIAFLALALGPATVSAPIRVTSCGAARRGVAMGANLVLLRRAFAPLQRLTRLMRRSTRWRPGTRLDGRRRGDRGARARRRVQRDARPARGRAPRERAAARSAAQEAERLRVARELHDEVGQTLTGVAAAARAGVRRRPGRAARRLEEVRETARGAASRRCAGSPAGCGRRRSTTSGCASALRALGDAVRRPAPASRSTASSQPDLPRARPRRSSWSTASRRRR